MMKKAIIVLVIWPLSLAACSEKQEPSYDDWPQTPAMGQTGWLEIPGNHMEYDDGIFCVTHHALMDGKSQRNYSLLYDSKTYTSYWVAYPLCRDHMGSGRKEKWQYDPKIDSKHQTSVTGGYSDNNFSTTNYESNYYARGHQLPNADRSGIEAMQLQTYHSTNLTPQIHKGFNGNIWKELESAVRKSVKSDTVYVVTGACFNKIGEKNVVKNILNKNDKKKLPIPNYYWKVLLKVERQKDGTVTSAQTAAFWLPHEDLLGKSWGSYQTTVDQIEEWTGFDFFVNLPVELQETAEAQKDWTEFSNF